MEDRIIKDFVAEELEWDPKVDAGKIGISVSEGVVTLTGHVTSYAQKVEAEAVCRRVEGVRGVVQELEVLSGALRSSDEDLAIQAANLLEWDAVTPDNGIFVSVEDGIITLKGEVEWEFQRAAAARAIQALKGLRHINNQITVNPRHQAEGAKARIEQALARQANLDARDISVSAEKGRVTLKGHVKTWPERDLVERTAWAAKGVHMVDDQIIVGRPAPLSF